MKLSKHIAQYKQFFEKPSRRYLVIGGVLLGLTLIYGVLFLIPKKVTYSYAGETCISQVTLFPSTLRSTDGAFILAVKDELKIGSFAYAATQVCVTPNTAPQKGEYVSSLQPFGGGFMATQFLVVVADHPEVRSSDIIGQTISTALPLAVQLTTPDTTHTYQLAIGDKTTDCRPEGAQLLCEVADLALAPGKEYTASLLRSFNQDEAIKVVEGELETLHPLVVQDASVSDGKTIYDSPKEFSFTFDKPIVSGKATLQQKNGESTETITTIVTAADNKVSIGFDTDLPRKTEFILTLNQVIGDNGGSLEAPIVVHFKTSGGPMPNNVSVARVGVPQNSQIVVTFDQPIKEGVAIAEFARVTGVVGSVSQRSATQLVFSIQGGLCQVFSLVIDKGVASGSNSAVSDAWKFDARTICGTTSVIGYSVLGRPLIAYTIGSGASTILFTGGIHGNEFSAQQTMQAWANHLMNYGYQVPANKRVIIVPNLNPDGIASGSRNNVNNVNLGRNYPSSNWKASIETANGVLPTGGGTEPGSEPETKAMMALTRQVRPRLEVSFHSQGRLVGANKYGDSVAIGNLYANTVGYGTMFYNAEEVMGYTITGEYEEWMGEEMGTPAILIELPSHYGNYLNSQLNALMKMIAV